MSLQTPLVDREPEHLTDVLIVGASQAGVQLASSLRGDGFDGTITLVGDEEASPYQRPPLSKSLLTGATEVESLAFRAPDFYAAQRIVLLLGTRVVAVESRDDGSGNALTDAGEVLGFRRLALTVGARARRLSIPGDEADGVFYLRDAADALRLRSALTEGRRVVVVGGGFIGLEVAASAGALGCEVLVVLADDRLMGRAVSQQISTFYADAHQRRGVTVRTATRPVRFIEDALGAVERVELADGTTVEADVVVVGVGAEPRTELAEDLGLRVDNGIVVDRHGVTSDGFTVAAGDCVSCVNPVFRPGGQERIRFESVSTAIEQAKAAAATVAGRESPYGAVPWFWSDQFDLKLQVAGIAHDSDSTIVRGDATLDKFSVLHFVGEQLVAVESVNNPGDFMAARAALNAGRTIDPDIARDTAQSLKSAVRDGVLMERAAI